MSNEPKTADPKDKWGDTMGATLATAGVILALLIMIAIGSQAIFFAIQPWVKP